MYAENDIDTWSEADYDRNMAEVSRLFNSPRDTPEGERLDTLLLLVGDYEDRHHAIPAPSPEAMAAFRRDQMGISVGEPVAA